MDAAEDDWRTWADSFASSTIASLRSMDAMKAHYLP